MRFRNSFTFAFALVSLAAPGCQNGQIGGEVEAGSDHCEVAGSEPREDDEDSSLGASAADLMDGVRGRFTVGLAWNAGADGVVVTPAAGESSITVEVEPVPGSARFVDLAPRDSNGMELAAPVDECKDELRFDARVTVTTKNGALDEVFEAEFRANSKRLVKADIAIDLGALDGTFSVDASAKNAEPVQTTLHLGFVGGSLSGSLDGILSTVDETSASAAPLDYAHFPVQGCGTFGGYVVDASSELGQAVSAALSESRSFEFSWSDGSPDTVLEVESSLEGPLCYGSMMADEDVVVAQLTTRATSEDGRIDGRWTLEGRVTSTDAGQVARVDVVRQAYLADVFPAADFEEESGISGVDLGDAGTASFSFSYGFDEGARASGELTVLASRDGASCVEEQEEEPDGGVSGCSGNDYEELVHATLVEAE